MVFSSFLFLCFFLPIVLILHTFVKNKLFRNTLLILASVFFYACGEPLYVILLLISVAVNYFFGLAVERKKSKALVAVSVMLNLAALVVFKYAGWLAESVNELIDLTFASAQGPAPLFHLPVPSLTLPVGISFYTFQALSYVIDVYRGEVKAQRRFFDLLLYISFFPQLIAGPIVQYHDIEDQLKERVVTAEELRCGILRFTVGLCKKVLIANAMAEAADAMYALENSQLTPACAWIGALAYLTQIYFDFSGYSDMAIGLGHMFGFTFKENFNYPFTADSIQDFWRRWHISLSTWFKQYLYIPLGGNRKGKARTYLNRFIVFLSTGLWHGAGWNFLLWGMFHGTFLVLESSGILPVSKLRSRFVRVLYTLFLVTIGFVMFRAETLSQAWCFYQRMFGVSAGLSEAAAGQMTALRFVSPYYGMIFAAALIGSTPLPKKLWQKTRMPGMILCLAGLILCFMSLASGSYNPFIYFRF